MTRIWIRIAALVLGLFVVATGCAQGTVGDQVTVNAILNGADLSASSPNRPVEISDDQAAELTLMLNNVSDEPVTVRYVRFEGEVIDMIFLTYDTALNVPLDAGEERTLPPLLLDFFDVGAQADGYMRGNVQLFDQDREPLGSQPMFLDASGEGLSTLQQFNLLLLGCTVLGIAWNLLRLSQRRLPTNRMVRALRFLAVGAGAGLTLAVAFSTLRIWPLRTLWWLLITIVGGIIGYAIGLWLPGSEGDDIDLLDEEDLLEELMLERDDMLVVAGVATGSAAAGLAADEAEVIDMTDAPQVVDPDDVATNEDEDQPSVRSTVPAGTKGAAKQTLAGASAAKTKGTVVGTKGGAKETLAGASAAKATVSKATGAAKQTVSDAASGAKQTVSKAPGSGARETVAKPSPSDKAPSVKETLADDDS